MKKLLLFAAVAMAFGASAQTLTQDWKHDVSFTANDTRQGVGMNGKIYVLDKSTQQVYVVSENGVENTILPGSTNTAINRDGAGNLVISTAAWAANWAAGSAGFMVYNPATPDQITNLSFEDSSLSPGKSFNIGIAAGDLTSNGELLVAGDASGSNLSRFVVVDGEISPDDSYPAIVNNGPAPATTTVINAFMDGEIQKYLYVTRNANPAILVANGDDFDAETLILPNKGSTNGAEIFVLGSDKYAVYPTLPNYLGGFAIAKLGVENTVMVEVEAPFSANPNGVQMDWLNAEVVDDYTANIYQYIPGAYCAKYTFSLPQSPTGISDVTAKKAEVKKVIENGQIYIINGDAKYNVMGAQVK